MIHNSFIQPHNVVTDIPSVDNVRKTDVKSLINSHLAKQSKVQSHLNATDEA
jgi:hypothetical protein